MKKQPENHLKYACLIFQMKDDSEEIEIMTSAAGVNFKMTRQELVKLASSYSTDPVQGVLLP